MEKELAGVMMRDNTIFHVDFIKRALRDSNNSKNLIPLTDKMFNGKRYVFQYDPIFRKNIDPEGTGNVRTPFSYEVQVRGLTAMRPLQMSRLYGVDLDQVLGKNDTQFFASLPDIRKAQRELMKDISDQRLFERRVRGVLPEMKIGFENYVVKWDKRLLQSLKDPDRKIYFKDLDISSDGRHYTCFFDLENRCVLKEGLRKDNDQAIALVVINDEVRLDPVGVARERGFADTDLLFAYPIEKDLQAQLVPLSERAFRIMAEETIKETMKEELKNVSRQNKGFGMN